MHAFVFNIQQLTVSLDGAKRRLCLLATVVFLLSTTVSTRGDWINVWSDDFDGTSVDTSKWTYDIGGGGWGNSEKEYYTSRTNNAYVSGGFLHIRAQIEDTNGNHYTSARLITQGKFAKTYGWIEFRAKLPQGVGFWPALWTLGTNIVSVGWPRCGEIDVMENKGTDAITVGGTIHYENGGGDIYQTQSYNLPTPGDSVTNFHTYAVQWSPTQIVWLVDNVIVKTWTSWTSSIGPFPAPFDRGHYFLMNVAVGGKYVGNPSEASIDPYMPGEMVVDYVHVYDFISSTNPPTTPTGLTATPGGSHIALNWNLSTNATSYNVKRSLGSGGPHTTIAMPTVTSYNDSNVVGGTTYYYVISGTNLFGESTNSVEASATPVPPPTPTGLMATPSGGSVALNWNSSSGATSYRVKRSLVMGGPYSLIGTPTSTSYADTDVASCTAYYYVVSATNLFGESTNSVEASATLGSYSAAINSGGNAAGNFVADAPYVSGGTVAAPTGSSIDTSAVTNPAPQTVYQTERYGTFTNTFSGLTIGTTYKVRLHFVEYYWDSANARKFNVSINGTQVLTNYDIFVAAGGQNKAIVDEYMVTPNGSGQIIIAYTVGTVDQPKSSGIEVILPAPVAPTGLVATAGDAQVALNWNAVSGATGYNLGRATNSVGPYAAVTNGLTGTSYTDASVVNGTTYYYVVSTVQAGCESTNSTEVSVTPTPQSEFPAWQMQYFGCTGCPEAAGGADPDGDGQDNTAEFMSGTNPTNSASAFHVISITETGSDVVIEWQAGGGKTNVVQATSSPGDSYATNFLDISSPIIISGSGDVITNYPDIGGATNTPMHFYRIRLGP
jgi:beta-glucanase (GH16 family)